MQKELQQHIDRNHWTVVKKSDMPPKMKSIMSIWAFKRKRYPSGEIIKYKARLCSHGGQQIWGENYWESFSLVVHCLSIRTMMAISIIHRLQTRSVNFTLAFPQEDLRFQFEHFFKKIINKRFT